MGKSGRWVGQVTRLFRLVRKVGQVSWFCLVSQQGRFRAAGQLKIGSLAQQKKSWTNILLNVFLVYDVPCYHRE